jgi:hypothetical protein
MRRVLATFSVVMLACVLAAHAQDSQSLGDAARQARLQKQQRGAEAGKDKTAAARPSPVLAPANTPTASKDAQGDATPQPPKAGKKVITNDEIPEHVGPTVQRPNAYQNPGNNYPQPNYPDQSTPADYWKNQIITLKNNILAMQDSIKSLENSIRYAANCVSNCVQWNERQQQKQAQVESMKSALDQQQRYLEQMQETARRQGFGSSVYDP